MDTITAAQPLLDRQENLAIWYATYEGLEESVLYANPLFCKTFELPLKEILERKRYHLVNPPETAEKECHVGSHRDRISRHEVQRPNRHVAIVRTQYGRRHRRGTKQMELRTRLFRCLAYHQPWRPRNLSDLPGGLCPARPRLLSEYYP